ncbi:MAG: hypothetical protein ACXVJT_08385 [Thermoanaerobaculia bacterium]
MADEKIPDALLLRKLRENGVQVILTELARSPTGRRERRQGGVRAT